MRESDEFAQQIGSAGAKDLANLGTGAEQDIPQRAGTSLQSHDDRRSQKAGPAHYDRNNQLLGQTAHCTAFRP